MSALLGLFVIGFFSGFHCAGMCGPVVYVAAQPLQIAMPVSRGRRIVLNLFRQLWYHLGRVLSYMTLGSIAGLLGAEFFSIGGLQSVFSYVLGVMILLAGLGYMGLLPKISNGRFAAIVNWAKGWLTTLQGHNSIESRLMLGLLTPLLPCGILYAIVIESASAGSVIGAALHMGAFALGTIPALLGFGALAASAQGPLRKHGPRLAGILLVVMGILTIARGAGFAVSIPFQSSKAVQCTSCKTQ